jgi:hypothetical protein
MPIWLTTMKVVTILIVLGLLLVIIGAVLIQLFTSLKPVILSKPDHQLL